MIVGIHQPEHLPWFGYFHKIVHVDKFIFLDNVQFKKNYFENRNRICTPNGLLWLTVPVKLKGHLNKKFYEMEINNNTTWRKKYLRSLEQTYRKAPFFEDLYPLIDFLEQTSNSNLSDFNIEIIFKICEILNIDKTKFERASRMPVTGQSSSLLISILKTCNGTKYLMGKSGYDYIDKTLFYQNKIEIIDHSFNYPIYHHFNLPGKEMPAEKPSIIDMIANIGKEKTINFLNQS